MKSFTTFAEAIRTQEGWYPGSRSQRNNNPGNMRKWDSSLPLDDAGYQIFPSYAAGWNALIKQIKKNVLERNLTMYEFFNGKAGVYGGYSPASDGNKPVIYAERVAQAVGVDPAVRLGTGYEWVDGPLSQGPSGPGGPSGSGSTGQGGPNVPVATSGGSDLPSTMSQIADALQRPISLGLPDIPAIPAWSILVGVTALSLLLRR